MQQAKVWFLLICSAVLYPCAFLYVQNFWWLVFVFPLPFLYVAIQQSITLTQAFVWGFISFGLHASGLLYSAMWMASGPWYYKLIPAIVFIVYKSLYAVALFGLTSWFISFAQLTSCLIRTIYWMLCLAVYIHVMAFYSWWIFDRLEGYSFLHPLLACAQQPNTLYFLPNMGSFMLLLLLLLPSAALILFFATHKRIAFVLFCVSILFWLISYMCGSSQRLQKPDWLNQVTYIPLKFDGFHETNTRAIATLIKKIVHDHPNITCVILPESSVHGTDIERNTDLWSYFSEKHLGKKLYVLIGSFCTEPPCYYNALYLFYDGTLIDRFDKRQAMLLTERIPSLFAYAFISDMYYQSVPPTTESTKKRPLWHIIGQSFVPYVCSELFLNNTPDDTYSHAIILAICNDIWAQADYLRILMGLHARLKAIYWQRPVLYISYTQSSFNLINGQSWPIACFNR